MYGVAIAGRKHAIDLDVSALPPLEAADNFLTHLRDSWLGLRSLPGITFTEPARRLQAEVDG